MSATSTHRLLLAAPLAVALALGLASCSGTTDGGDTHAGTGSPSSAVTDAATDAGLPAAQDGVTELWRAPGVPVSLMQETSQVLVMDFAGGTAAVHDVQSTSGDPLWSGDCQSAMVFTDRIACDATLIDPATGAVTDLPAGTVSPAGGDAEHLAVRTDAGAIVGYDSDLAEIWRIDGGFTPPHPWALTGRVLPLVADGADGSSMTNWTFIDVETGVVLADGGLVYATDDGYVIVPEDMSSATAYTWDGVEVERAQTPDGFTFVQSEFGGATTIANFFPGDDVKAVTDEAATSFSLARPIMLGGTVVLFQKVDDATFTVDGQTFTGDPLGVMGMPGGEQFIALAPGGEVGANPFEQGQLTSLYQVGSSEPLWTVEGGFNLLAADGSVIATGVDQTIVYSIDG